MHISIIQDKLLCAEFSLKNLLFQPLQELNISHKTQHITAVLTQSELLDEPSVIVADIGGWTVDLMRLDNRIPCWENTTSQNKMQSSSANRRGCFLLSMSLPTGVAAGSALTPNGQSCATFTTTTRICGPGCWSCRPFPAR